MLAPDLVCEGDVLIASIGAPASAAAQSTETLPMKTLITALALAILVAAPAFSLSAVPAAHKTGRDTCQSQQNDKCYYRGYPLWQWYSS